MRLGVVGEGCWFVRDGSCSGAWGEHTSSSGSTADGDIEEDLGVGHCG